MDELIRDFWWLVFPFLGMCLAVAEIIKDGARADRVIDRARRQLEER